MRTAQFVAVALVAIGCGIIQPVKHVTPGGITIVYHQNDGSYRLPRDKVREIDQRWAALNECIPQEVRCRKKVPAVQIKGPCDSFIDPYGVRVRGETAIERVLVPGSLGALAHEWSHLIACDSRHGKGSWSRECGDVIDSGFRRIYPPHKCKGDP